MDAQARPLPPPKTGRGEITRRKILDAARREIGKRGFAESSISSITAAAGVGQGTFYLYFRSKEEVMRELVQHMGRSLRRHLTEAIEGAADRIEAERRGLRAYLEFARKNPAIYRIVEESQFVDPAIYRRYYTDFARSYRQALTQAAKRGEISPGNLEVRAWALMGMAVFLGQRYGVKDTKTPLGPVVDAAVDLIAHGMAA
jgi:AcrR family transcriptional regulator